MSRPPDDLVEIVSVKMQVKVAKLTAVTHAHFRSTLETCRSKLAAATFPLLEQNFCDTLFAVCNNELGSSNFSQEYQILQSVVS